MISDAPLATERCKIISISYAVLKQSESEEVEQFFCVWTSLILGHKLIMMLTIWCSVPEIPMHSPL